MRASGGGDFSAYVAARWPSLVRSLVLMGVPVEDAQDVATDALSRCQRDWHEAERCGDVDGVVWEAVEDAFDRYCRHHPATTGYDSALVLAHYAGRPGIGATRTARAEGQLLREAVERTAVGAPPTQEELDRRAWQRRTRTNSRVVLVLAPVLVLVAAATAWGMRDRGDGLPELGNAELTRAENPVATLWYADGELHLQHAVLDVPGIEQVTQIGSGAVYVDRAGWVVEVEDDGSRTAIGRTDEPLRASDESDWAAWHDQRSDETVVYDLVEDRRVATRRGATEVIGVDGTTIYLREDGEAEAWQPESGTTTKLDEGDGAARLLDVRARKKMLQLQPGTIEVVQSLYSVDFVLPGQGGDMSADGNFVTTSIAQETVLYDTRSGRRVRNGLADGDVIQAAAGADRGLTTYVVDTAQGTRELKACEMRTSTCTVAAQLDPQAPVPLLAR